VGIVQESKKLSGSLIDCFSFTIILLSNHLNQPFQIQGFTLGLITKGKPRRINHGEENLQQLPR